MTSADAFLAETVALGPFTLSRADAYRLLLIQGHDRQDADAMAFGHCLPTDDAAMTLQEVADFFGEVGDRAHEELAAAIRRALGTSKNRRLK